MLKLIGGILVAGSGVGLAVNMIAEIRQHLLRLYEIRQLLINISGEAALALLPMEHILNQPTLTNDVVLQKVCGQIADRLAAKKVESGGKIWWDIFWKNRKELGICASELEIIANAGNAFFGRNIKENERMLSIYLERLDFVIEQERKDQREKQRVAGAVSVIGGMKNKVCIRQAREGTGLRMSVNLIFKIAAVGILVTVISQVLKHSGREEHAFLTSLAGLLIVLFWIVPYIYELFETMQSLFAL